MSGYILGPEALQQLRQVVRQVLGEHRNPAGHRGRWRAGQRRVQGKLDGGLDAADGSEDAPTTAVMSVYRKNSSGNMEDSGKDITVTNRFLYVDAAAGTWCKAEYIDGEWQLYAADCGR